MVRDPHSVKSQELQKEGAKLVVADYEQPDTLKAAVQGVERIYVCTPPTQHAHRHTVALLTAIKSHDNHKPFVLRLSAVGAAADAPTDNGKSHHQCDQELISSGLPHAIIRPHFFMQNLYGSIQTIVTQSKMYWGMGDGKLAMIDLRDIVAVSAAILHHPQPHHGKIYNPTGPQSLDLHEVARIISKHYGKEVTYVPVSIEAVGETMRKMGASEWTANVMMQYSKAYSNSWASAVTPDVKAITGQEARSLDQFVSEEYVHALRAAAQKQQPAADEKK